MEYEKIANLLGKKIQGDKLSRFITKKWVKIYDESGKIYSVNKEVRFKTPQLRNHQCDYNNSYLVVTDPDNDAYDKKLALKIMHLFLEQSVLSKITIFSTEKIILQHVLGYYIDAYFLEHKLAVEIDEKGHHDRDIQKEIERQKALEK